MVACGNLVSPAIPTADPSVVGGVGASHGKETMIKTAQDNPGVFFATCARLIGPEVKLTIINNIAGQSVLGGLADNEGDRRGC